jgi:hypothetical protein
VSGLSLQRALVEDAIQAPADVQLLAADSDKVELGSSAALTPTAPQPQSLLRV